MASDATIGRIGNPSSIDSSAQIAESVWTPPSSASGRNVELAAMTRSAAQSGSEMLKPLEVVDFKAEPKAPTMADLATEARDSVGSRELGNVSPAEARELPNFKVPPHVKCASTVSTWLVEAGFMKNQDFKVRVTDPKGQGLEELLPELGFKPSQISGKIDPKAFPEGPIGIIAGTEKYNDGSNHVGFLEKRNGELRVMHNRSGRVADDPLIGSYFYDGKSNSRFGNMKLFVLDQGTAIANNK